MDAKWKCQPRKFYSPINMHARLYSMYRAPSRPASLIGTESALNTVPPLLLSSMGSSGLPYARFHRVLADPGPLPLKHPGRWGDAFGGEQRAARYPLPSRGSGMLPTAIAAPLRLRQMETKTEEVQSVEQCSTQGKSFPTDTYNTSFYISVPGVWLPLS